MMRMVVALVLLVFAAAAFGSPPASELAPIHGTYAPKIDPANFVAKVDNPYLPFKPGTRFHYEGVRGTTPQTDNEVVLRKTKRVLGIRCTIVRDTVSEHGHAGEQYRQEYYPPGEALDEARVLGIGGSVTVPYGTFERPLVTLERSPLEPQTEKKYYVREVGEVKEKVVKGHHEQFELVNVTHRS